MHPKYSALFTSVNLLLGVGPLILPMPFFDAGLGLSLIWMVLICLLSYNSAMYTSESMSKLVQIRHDNAGLLAANPQSSILTVEDESKSEEGRTNQQSEETEESGLQEKNKTNQLGHSQQFGLLFGKKWEVLPSITITVYLLGTSISKCIMTAKTLEKVFQDADAPWLFKQFFFWLTIFFVAGALFSFRSIDKTKVLQAIIIGARVLTISLFLGGAIFLFCRDGVKKLTPSNNSFFNFSSFVDIFSNSVFALMFHHSLPNIVGSLKTTEQVRFVIKNAFLISGAILIIIPVTAAMAFGSELGEGTKLVYYNFDFQSKIPFIFWITSFYVFLNIAAFSVYIIVIRTNVLNIVMPKVNPKVFNKQTVITTVVILLIILSMSWLLETQIQIVLDFTGGIFGIFILFFIPAAEVYKARELMHREGNPRNYIRLLPILISVLGAIFMGLNIYGIIRKLVNGD